MFPTYNTHRASYQEIGSNDTWGDLSGEIVMDVGCGNGSNSAKHVVNTFPRLKKVLAIDKIPEVIEEAKEENAHPKIDYIVADIEDKSTLVDWENKLDRIVSYHCFNYVNDQTVAFENVYRLLKPGGRAEILFRLRSSYFDALGDIRENPKYAALLENVILPNPQVKNTNTAHYRNLLEKIGFIVVCCAERNYEDRYFDSEDENWRKVMTSAPWYEDIPADVVQDYEMDLYQAFTKYTPRNRENLSCFTDCIITVYLRKPK